MIKFSKSPQNFKAIAPGNPILSDIWLNYDKKRRRHRKTKCTINTVLVKMMETYKNEH